MAHLIDRIAWRLRMLRHALTLMPISGADDPPADPPKDDPPKDDPPAADPPKDDPDKVVPDDDWQAKARKHERAARREREAREKAEKALKERQEADKSEQEKALEKAREEGRTAATTELEKERRADRLDAAVTRLAYGGIEIEVKDGDETKTKKVKFADSEDALAAVERAMARGDISADDIYDDEGKVKSDALKEELASILKAKPHYAAGDAPPPSTGDPDLGKGEPASGDLEKMTVEDHLDRKDPGRKK